MGEMLLIEGALKRAARRRRFVAAWGGFWKGLLFGAILWLATYGVFKLYPIPKLALVISAWTAGAILSAMTLIGCFKRHSLIETARRVANRQRLKETLSTALEISIPHGMSDWQ